MSRLKYYQELIEHFLSGTMPVDEFQLTYLDRFKKEVELEEPLFELLDELFADVDSFTSDPQLLEEKPALYLNEATLREKVQRAAARLSDMKH